MEVIALAASGIALGSIYALLALAINIVFSARRVVNFAQGDLVMLGALIGVAAIAAWGLPYLAGLLLACVLVAAFAVLIERVAIRPLPSEETDIAWILSIVAVAIITANAGQLIFGTETRAFPSLLADMPVMITGLWLVPDQVAAIAATVLFMIVFHLLLNRTMHGKALKAAARDPDMAAMLGIDVRRYIAYAFALSGIIAALAGFLVGPITFVNAQFGFALGIKGFAAAALGGLGTFGGALLGGMILGLAEIFSGAYLGTAAKDSVSLLILCVILIFRPTGLIGEARIVKV